MLIAQGSCRNRQKWLIPSPKIPKRINRFTTVWLTNKSVLFVSVLESKWIKAIARF
jgi:hypothetical protein